MRDIFETVVVHFLSFSFRAGRKHPLDTIPKLSQASVQLRGNKNNLCQKLKSDAYGTQRHLAFVIIPIRTHIHERVVEKIAFIVRSQIQVNRGGMRM